MKRMKRVFCALTVFLALALGAGAQGSDRDAMAADLAIQGRLMRLKMQGLIPFRFASARDNSPIAGASVVIAGIGSFTTNNEGIITFPEQEDGFYTLRFSKAGFITTDITFEVKLNNVFGNRFSISPNLEGASFRIVLDWGDRPDDLDLHFVKEGGAGPGYHISYRNMRTPADGAAVLDRDDMSAYGPETITAARTERAAVYTVYVQDYTNGGNRTSRALADSYARVLVYGNGVLLRVFYVPAGIRGDRWEVCRIVGGEILEGER